MSLFFLQPTSLSSLQCFIFFFAKSYANFRSQSLHFTCQDFLKVSNVGVFLLQPGSLAANLYCSGQLYGDEGEAKRHHHNVAWFVSFFTGQCTWHKHLDNCYTKNLATYNHCLTLCALCPSYMLTSYHTGPISGYSHGYFP